MIEIDTEQANAALCQALARMCNSGVWPCCPAYAVKDIGTCPFEEGIICYSVKPESWADILVIKPQDETEPDGDDPLSEEDERELKEVLEELEEPYKEFLE